MSDLLDRYLSAVARELPSATRNDILAELRDELLSKFESQEESLDHPLSRDEMGAVLKDFGHPMVVGARYRKTQYVVGPDIFPFWWASLRVALAITAGVYLVFLVMFSVFDLRNSGGHLPNIQAAVAAVFGAVTLVAMAIERLGLVHIFYNWRPTQLPPAGHKVKSRFGAVVEIGMNMVALLWWTGAIHIRNWFPAPDVIAVHLAPIWSAFYWPILIYFVFETGVNLLALTRPGLDRINAALSLICALFGTAIVIQVIKADHWLVIATQVLTPKILAQTQANFDLGMKVGLVVTMAMFVFRGCYASYKLWQAFQAQKPLAALTS